MQCIDVSHSAGPGPGARLWQTNVVTTRAIARYKIADASRINARYPQVRGAPIAQDDPAAIGIAALTRADYGDPVALHPDEVPAY
ncbi:MAG: DUF1445 domain-containing protein [Pseudomonadota bacterium]